MIKRNPKEYKHVWLMGDTPLSEMFKDAQRWRKKSVVIARRVETIENLDTVLSDGLVETSREVPVGHWIITNPGGEEYAISNEKFLVRYDSLGDGQYRAKGVIRAYQNPTGSLVRITAPWGEPQYGDDACWFAAAADEDGSLSEDRYIIGGVEFLETYEVA